MGRRRTDLDLADVAARQAALAAQQAEHERRITDHDNVLEDIRDHLAAVISEFGKFQTRVLVAAALVFAGSPQGMGLIHQLIG